MVVAAEHVADPRVDVVHDHGEVVERRAIGAQDHEVLDVLALESDAVVHRVVPGDLPGRHAQADGALVEVGLAFGEQLVGDVLVALDSRALEDGLLVPIEPQPREAVEDDLGVLVTGAGLVGVLDTQQELAAHVPGVEPIEEGGAGAPDVEVARGGGGEADAGGHGC